MPIPPEVLRGIALRLVFAALALLTVGSIWEEPLVRATLPAMRGWFELVDHRYRTLELGLVDRNGELVVERSATPARIHVVGSDVVYPDARTRISTQVLAGIVLQPLILAGSVLAAWPFRQRREFALRWLLALPALAAAWVLDVPMLLYGFLWQQELAQLDPDALSPLVTWADLMNAGGRFVLALGSAGLAIAAARNLTVPAVEKARSMG